VTALVRAESRGGIDVLTLDSQANRNALSLQALEELLDGIAASDGRALLLDHEGPVFCAGVDLRERSAPGADQRAHSHLLARVLRELWAYPRPVLCRVGGAVRGGGMGLVAAADVAVAAPTATFAFSEVRVGVAPALVGALALQKLPAALLLPLLLTGEPFDAAAAQRAGFVAEVADDDRAAVERRCEAVRAAAPAAVATTKALVRRLTATAEIGALLEQMEQLSAELFSTAEAAEGMAAFAERRPPAWAV
jgi:enoyl-CoA hydratase/carnithine racemase